jgi:anti-sigma factor RsiW
LNKQPETGKADESGPDGQNTASRRVDWQEWEDQINALLDGDLDDAQAEQLKTAASSDQRLARAIIESYQLQQALAAIPQQRAPASLRRKLAGIPQQERRLARAASRWWWRPPQRMGTWATALVAIPMVVITLSQLGPKEPSAAEIAQAQQELIVALSYLEKVSHKARQEIGDTVNREMQENVNENMTRALHEPFEFNKERNT